MNDVLWLVHNRMFRNSVPAHEICLRFICCIELKPDYQKGLHDVIIELYKKKALLFLILHYQLTNKDK